MKILFSHQKNIKLFPLQQGNEENYSNMVNFIKKNFSNLPLNFIVKYKDQDGDKIVIQSNKDIQALFDNKNTDYVRAQIEQEVQSNDEDFNSEMEDEQQDQNEDSSGDDLKSESNQKQDSNQSDQKQDSNQSDQKQDSNQALIQENSENIIEANKTNQDNQQIQDMNIIQNKLIKEQSLIQNKIQVNQQQFQTKNETYQALQLTIKPQLIGYKEYSQQKEQIICGISEKKNETNQKELKNQDLKASLEQQVKRLVQQFIKQQLQSKIMIEIPKITQIIKQDLNIQKPLISNQQNKSISSIQSKTKLIIHQVSCSVCQIQQIQGIRYKCLQCKKYNLCSSCQTVINHQHNLLKMKIPQQNIKSQQTDLKIDQQVQFTNKCFYLASYFGGQPHQYKTFVLNQNYQTKQSILQHYFNLYPKNLKKRMGPRLQQTSKKLAFYFNKSSLDYIDIVRKNPLQSFESLIRMIKEQSQSQCENPQFNIKSKIKGNKKRSQQLRESDDKIKKSKEQKRKIIKNTQIEEFKKQMKQEYDIKQNDAARMEIIEDYCFRNKKQFQKSKINYDKLVQNFHDQIKNNFKWVKNY